MPLQVRVGRDDLGSIHPGGIELDHDDAGVLVVVDGLPRSKNRPLTHDPWTNAVAETGATIATGKEVSVRTISHRELRNNSAEVLRAVGAGETIEVTNHGEVAAVLVPPSLTPYERLVAAGKVREPRKDRPVDLRSIRRVTAPVSSTEIIADVRGDR
jgi:prevent-host-death family protein